MKRDVNNFIIDIELVFAILDASYEYGQYSAEKVIPGKLERRRQIQVNHPNHSLLDRIARQAAHLSVKKYIRTIQMKTHDGETYTYGPVEWYGPDNFDDITNIKEVYITELTLKGCQLYFTLLPHKKTIENLKMVEKYLCDEGEGY